MVKKLTHTVITAILIAVAITIIVLQLIGLAGCKKQVKKNASADKASAMKIINTMAPTRALSCDLPTTEDGILVFNDAEHYQCYYNFLTNAIESDTSGKDIDSTLLFLETALGYTSIRSVALAGFEEMNKVGWPRLEDIPEEDWISSRVRRSILNQNREVKIGGDYMKYLSPEFMVTVDANYTEIMQALRNLGSNPALEDILNLDLQRNIISISSLTILDKVFGSNKYADGTGKNGTPVKPTGDWQVSGTVYAPNNCDNNPGYVYFEGFTASFQGVPNKCRYVIQTNDGAGTVYDKISTLGTNQSLLETAIANYPGGMFFPKVLIYGISPKNTGNTPIAELSYQVNVRSLSQTCGEYSEYSKNKTQYYYINSTHAIKGRVEFHTWRDLIQQKKCELDGYTSLHVLKDGNWNRQKDKKTHLCINLVGDIRYGDFCDPVSDNLTPKYKCTTNDNQVYAERQYDGWRRYRKVTARHEVSVNGGVSGYFEQYISVCD